MMDPDNPVVKLCAEGMRAEGDGHYADAASLFRQAWAMASDDYEACIAAHFVARHQPSPEETLRWNAVALTRAAAVADDRVRDFYPSLFLNMGYACEQLGNLVDAAHHYHQAALTAGALPDDRYGSVVRDAIGRGRQRLDAPK